MRRREPRERSAARTATWLAAGGALLGTATLLWRRKERQIDASVRYSEVTGRGRPATPASPGAEKAGHETLDMRGGLMAKLFLLLGSVAVCMVFAMVGLRLWVTAAQRDDRPPLTAEQTVLITPPGPHLQRDPLGEIAALRRRDDGQLGGYAYLDDARTRARIPIDRAMALTVGQPLAAPP